MHRRSRQHRGLWSKGGREMLVSLWRLEQESWFKVWSVSRGISRMESSNGWEEEIVARPGLEMATCLYVWDCCQACSKESKEEELLAPSWEGLGTCPKMWPLPLASTLRGQCLWTVVTLLPQSSLSLRPWGRLLSFLGSSSALSRMVSLSPKTPGSLFYCP